MIDGCVQQLQACLFVCCSMVRSPGTWSVQSGGRLKCVHNQASGNVAQAVALVSWHHQAMPGLYCSFAFVMANKRGTRQLLRREGEEWALQLLSATGP
jgi:hypothetical protein